MSYGEDIFARVDNKNEAPKSGSLSVNENTDRVEGNEHNGGLIGSGHNGQSARALEDAQQASTVERKEALRTKEELCMAFIPHLALLEVGAMTGDPVEEAQTKLIGSNPVTLRLADGSAETYTADQLKQLKRIFRQTN